MCRRGGDRDRRWAFLLARSSPGVQPSGRHGCAVSAFAASRKSCSRSRSSRDSKRTSPRRTGQPTGPCGSSGSASRCWRCSPNSPMSSLPYTCSGPTGTCASRRTHPPTNSGQVPPANHMRWAAPATTCGVSVGTAIGCGAMAMARDQLQRFRAALDDDSGHGFDELLTQSGPRGYPSDQPSRPVPSLEGSGRDPGVRAGGPDAPS